MKINNVGYKFIHDSDFYINRPNGSGDYILLFLRTDAVFTVDGQDILAKARSFMLFNKGTPQLYRACGASFANDWIHFDLDREELAALEALRIPFDTPLPCGDITYFSHIIKLMYQEHYSAALYRESMLELYFRLICFKLSERLSISAELIRYPYYDRMSALRTDIYANPSKQWTIDAMASSLALSSSYFQHLYKKAFGNSAISDVVQSRIEHAKYLLSNTDYPITRIALECGYKNDVHFMRQFKSTTTVTPSSYRKANLYLKTTH